MLTPTKKNLKWDAHTLYKTVSHKHMSMLVNDSDLIDLMLIECDDGRWFITEESSIINSDDFFDAYSDTFVEPKFYVSFDDAEKAGCHFIADQTSKEFDEIYPYFEE